MDIGSPRITIDGELMQGLHAYTINRDDYHGIKIVLNVTEELYGKSIMERAYTGTQVDIVVDNAIAFRGVFIYSVPASDGMFTSELVSTSAIERLV